MSGSHTTRANRQTAARTTGSRPPASLAMISHASHSVKTPSTVQANARAPIHPDRAWSLPPPSTFVWDGDGQAGRPILRALDRLTGMNAFHGQRRWPKGTSGK